MANVTCNLDKAAQGAACIISQLDRIELANFFTDLFAADFNKNSEKAFVSLRNTINEFKALREQIALQQQLELRKELIEEFI